MAYYYISLIEEYISKVRSIVMFGIDILVILYFMRHPVFTASYLLSNEGKIHFYEGYYFSRADFVGSV